MSKGHVCRVVTAAILIVTRGPARVPQAVSQDEAGASAQEAN